MGADHVGIARWDGGVNGLQDVSDLPKITAALRDKSISSETIGKIWSGNMLRLLRRAEEARDIGK